MQRPINKASIVVDDDKEEVEDSFLDKLTESLVFAFFAAAIVKSLFLFYNWF